MDPRDPVPGDAPEGEPAAGRFPAPPASFEQSAKRPRRRTRSQAWRAWRGGRPFPGAVLMTLGGAEILLTEKASIGVVVTAPQIAPARRPKVVLFELLEHLQLEGLRPRFTALGRPGTDLELFFARLLHQGMAMTLAGEGSAVVPHRRHRHAPAHERDRPHRRPGRVGPRRVP